MEELKIFNLDNALKRCEILNSIVNGETVIQPAQMTNSERFRAMNDDEQQKFVRRFLDIEDFADWLQQPVEDLTEV